MTTAPTSLRRRPRMSPVWFAGAVILVLIAVSIALAVQRNDPTSNDPREGSGVIATQVRRLEPFSSVDLAGANTVSITVGSDQRVAVTGDDNLLDRVITTVSGGALAIDNSGDFRTHTAMTVDIEVPTLSAVTLSGSGTITVVGVTGESFTVRLPGAGTIEGSGRVDDVSASIDGSGTIEIADLMARDAIAGIGGSGTILLYASRSLDATIKGTGSIVCSGSPSEVARRVTGTGTITS